MSSAKKTSKIGGKVREQVEFGKKVGLFVGEVIAINPSAKEFVSILGYEAKEDATDQVYIGESKDQNRYVRLDFWIRETRKDKPFQNKVVFFVEDRVRRNKDESKTQYINNIGVCSWAETEDDLPSWFSERPFREAKSGEEELYNFLRNWLGKIDYFSKDEPAELELNWKQLMKGDISELTDQIGGEFTTPFISLATVITKEVEGEVKEYQGIYNKAFAPEFSMKQFRLLDYNNESLQEAIEAKKFKDRKTHEKFVLNVVGEYGCKDFYLLSELTDYDPSLNVVASDSTIERGEDGDDDDAHDDSPEY